MTYALDSLSGIRDILYLFLKISYFWFFILEQEERTSETGSDTEIRESTLFAHACFLIKNMSQREEHIRDISVNLLIQLRDKFPQVQWYPWYSSLDQLIGFFFLWALLHLSVKLRIRITCMQVLWNSSCLDSLLFSVGSDTPGVINDPAWIATVRSLYQRLVQEWVITSLSYAPCTTQGLLQVDNCTPFYEIFWIHIFFFPHLFFPLFKYVNSQFFGVLSIYVSLSWELDIWNIIFHRWSEWLSLVFFNILLIYP